MNEAAKAKISKSKGKTGAAKKKSSPTKAAKASASGKKIVPLTPEFVADLKKVFAKHNWPGHPIGFTANPHAAALGLQPCDPGPPTCPDGSTPLQQWVHCPDGTSILRNFCP